MKLSLELKTIFKSIFSDLESILFIYFSLNECVRSGSIKVNFSINTHWTQRSSLVQFHC
ncbi:unnamed protein product [Moneuplotes crassus]|uniref:Uncharacterized protein n=1 Tax=Euplotes crassus TaxID=5936 RepID=A0AAD2D7K8_EUPCR|nr:unnamed protein product [Moneuplotes crassus]